MSAMRCIPLFHESGTQRFFVLSEIRWLIHLTYPISVKNPPSVREEAKIPSIYKH